MHKFINAGMHELRKCVNTIKRECMNEEKNRETEQVSFLCSAG